MPLTVVPVNKRPLFLLRRRTKALLVNFEGLLRAIRTNAPEVEQDAQRHGAPRVLTTLAQWPSADEDDLCAYDQKTQNPLMKDRTTPPPNFQKQV